MSIDTIKEHADIVIANTDDAPRSEWLLQRRQGIGGSDAAAVLSMSKWESRYSLWADKTDPEPPVEEPTEPMKWGHRLERAIGYGFAEDTGIGVTPYPVLLRSQAWPWMQVNLDFITTDAEAVLEVKNVTQYAADDWDDQIPDMYQIQGQHELAVTGLRTVWFAALIGGNDPRYFKVERNDVIIETLVEQEREFWELVKSLTPPEVDGHRATKQALADQYEAVPDLEVDLPSSAAALLEHRAALKREIKYLKDERLVEVENQLRALMGNATVGLIDGQVAVTYKEISKKPFTVTPKPYRSFWTPKGEAE